MSLESTTTFEGGPSSRSAMPRESTRHRGRNGGPFQINKLNHGGATVDNRTQRLVAMPSQDAEFDVYDNTYQSLVEDSMGFSGMSHDYVTRVKADLIVET